MSLVATPTRSYWIWTNDEKGREKKYNVRAGSDSDTTTIALYIQKGRIHNYWNRWKYPTTVDSLHGRIIVNNLYYQWPLQHFRNNTNSQVNGIKQTLNNRATVNKDSTVERIHGRSIPLQEKSSRKNGDHAKYMDTSTIYHGVWCEWLWADSKLAQLNPINWGKTHVRSVFIFNTKATI